MSTKNIFKKIIDKEIPVSIVHEDDLCLAFKDISPQAPVHLLIIPKKEIASLAAVTEEDAALLGHMMCVIQHLAETLGLARDGYRVVSNCGLNAFQTVPHLHFHLLGGRTFGWPPG